MHFKVWRRGGEGWEADAVVRPDPRLTLEGVGVDLSFAEIYEDVFS